MVHARAPNRQDFQIRAGRQHVLGKLHGRADVDYGVGFADASDSRVIIGGTVEMPGSFRRKRPGPGIVGGAGKDRRFVVGYNEEGEGSGLGHAGSFTPPGCPPGFPGRPWPAFLHLVPWTGFPRSSSGAEGAGNPDSVGVGFQEVIGADVVDAVALAFLNPHVAPAGPAAEPTLRGSGGSISTSSTLGWPGPRCGVRRRPVVAAQVAGIVVGHSHIHHADGLDPSCWMSRSTYWL